MKLFMYKMVHFLQLLGLVFTVNLNCMLKKSPQINDFRSCCLFTQEGSLTVITGPMYAGKTENLILYIKQAQEQGLKYLVFKHASDTRTSNTIKSRALQEQIKCEATDLAMFILHRVIQEMPRVVFIDEAQFFSDTLVDVVDRILKAHINVIISGLDTNFRREPFRSMPYLQNMAQTKIRLQAMCNVCNKWNAEFTQRLVNGIPAKKSDPDIIIDDGKNKIVVYEPRCEEHHIL